MIAPPGSHMDGPANLLVLNVASGKRQNLGPEAQLAEFPGDRILRELDVMSIDRFLIPLEQLRFFNAPFGNMHQPNGPVLVLHWEDSTRPGGDEVDLTCGKVGDVRLVSQTESVALLGLLFAKIEAKRENAARVFEIDLHPVCTCYIPAAVFPPPR